MIVVKFFEFQRIPFNEDMYYVYEHSIEGKVFYVGKGCKDRTIVFKGRNELWNKHVYYSHCKTTNLKVSF